MNDKVRLIDADLLTTTIAQIAKACAKSDKQKALVGRILFIIEHMPTIEAQPVKHGRWIKHRIDDPKSILHGAVKDTTCSVCGKSTPYNTEYCMHCGARMGGDKDNNVRNLTNEETAIYESWIESEAKDTGVNIMDGDN